MTEYEITKEVLYKLGYHRVEDYYAEHRCFFDPCNNAQQAWEIMLANNISVTKSRGKYISFYDLRYENPDDGHIAEIETQDDKPFVAAMLCFLEI